jgi:hypothetical protein
MEKVSSWETLTLASKTNSQNHWDPAIVHKKGARRKISIFFCTALPVV